MTEIIKEKPQKFYIQTDDIKEFILSVNKLSDKITEFLESFKME